MEVEFQRLGKRTHREATAARRHKETEALQEIGKNLPISQSQIDRSNQSSLLRLAINFIRARDIIKAAGFDHATLKAISSNQPLDFSGFVILVDLKGNILYATEKITDQLGPYLSELVGESVTSLVHSEDVNQLRELLDGSILTMLNAKKSYMFVVRMKSNLSANLKQNKQPYKNVFITCWLKALGSRDRKNTDNGHSESAVLVFLCRTEDLIGFPEIVIGSYVDFESSTAPKVFTNMDSKGQWLLGYRTEDIVGQDPFLFRHPLDKPSVAVRKVAQWYVHQKMRTDGMIKFPRSRFLTAWGEWVWTQCDVYPLEMKGNVPILCRARLQLLEPDDGLERSGEWRTRGTSFEPVFRYISSLNIPKSCYKQEDFMIRVFMHLHDQVLLNGSNPLLASSSTNEHREKLAAHLGCPYANSGSSMCSGSEDMEGPSPLSNSHSDYWSEPSSVGSSHHSQEVHPSTVHQTIPSTADQSMPSTVDQGMPSTVDQGMPSTVDQGMPCNVDQSIPITVDQGMPYNVDQSIPITVDQGMPCNVDQSIPSTVDQGMPSTVNQGMPCNVDQSMPSTVDQGIAELTLEDDRWFQSVPSLFFTSSNPLSSSSHTSPPHDSPPHTPPLHTSPPHISPPHTSLPHISPPHVSPSLAFQGPHPPLQHQGSVEELLNSILN